MKVNRPISPILTLKLVAMTKSIEGLQKEGQISNLQSNTYHKVKIWWKSVRECWDNLSEKFILKKVITPDGRQTYSYTNSNIHTTQLHKN